MTEDASSYLWSAIPPQNGVPPPPRSPRDHLRLKPQEHAHCLHNGTCKGASDGT